MHATARLLALCLLGTSCLAEPNKSFPQVDDSSDTEPNGSRVIRLAVEVAAPSDAVWRAFTTSEGWKSFAVALASVDFRVGGIIETSYNPQALVGDPDNIKNEIVAYVPGRILAIRCVQAPRNFEHKQEFFATSTLIEIVPVSEKASRVLATSAGFKPGAAYDALFPKFRLGNAYTLDKLRLRFEQGQAKHVPEASTDTPKPR